MRILLADDERAIAITLRDDLERAGHKVTIARDGHEAKALLAEQTFDVLVTDIKMPGPSGIELLQEVKRSRPETEVVIITGYGTIESAVDATKKGAFEYVLKPFDNDQILVTLQKIEEFHRLRQENAELRQSLGREKALEQVVGRSPAMSRVLDRVRAVAESDANVLITGESGTGKERVARAIHELSRRRAGPFVAVRVRGDPGPSARGRDLRARARRVHGREGAQARPFRAGRRRAAIFLDDIDDMPIETQVKLLRVLQERQFERLGGEKPVKVDVRVIAATKVDLAEAVRGRRVPRGPLLPAERRPARAAGAARARGRRAAARRALPAPPRARPRVHDPARDDGRALRLPLARQRPRARERRRARDRARARRRASSRATPSSRARSAAAPRAARDEPSSDALVALKDVVREAESAHIRRVLKASGGHRANAAQTLGISRKNLWEKMKEYGIE